MNRDLIFNDLVVEITRKCNLRCAHCIRGDAQDIDISHDTIDALLDRTDSIGMLFFTGGEPTCNIDGMEYFYGKLVANNIPLNKLQIVTNGTILSERFVELIKKYYAWISDHRGTYNKFIELLISKDRYHTAEGADADAALSYYRERLNDEHIIIAPYGFADRHIKPFGRASDIIGPHCPPELSRMYRAASIPRITRIEVMASGTKCLCPLRQYDKIEPRKIRILCPVEVTVYGNIISAQDAISDSNPIYVISNIWSKDILSDIKKYNDGKPYCVEYDSIKALYYQRCAEQYLPKPSLLLLWQKYVDDDIKRTKKAQVGENVDFKVDEETYTKIYEELLYMRKSAATMNYYKKHGVPPSGEYIAMLLDEYQNYYVDNIIKLAKDNGLIQDDSNNAGGVNG